MPGTNSITAPKPDASPRSLSAVPKGQWLSLGDVAAAIALGTATWPERPGIRAERQEAGHG